MLKEIRCDSLAEQNRILRFREGLNVVLGSSNGSNAIGKTTALWLIEYAFCGEKYHTLWKETADRIGRDPVFFCFRFGSDDYWFYRTLEEPKVIVRCDAHGNSIDRKSLDWFRAWLAEQYGITATKLSISEIMNRYFRIYGADNTFEHMPYSSRMRETSEQSLEFLIRLSGNGTLLDALHEVFDRTGVSHLQPLSTPAKPVDLSIIARNEKEIAALQVRLSATMESEDGDQLSFIGFTTEEFDKIQELQKRIRFLVRKRNQAVAARDAIANVRPHPSVNMAEEFASLQVFFPSIEQRPFDQIESFHRRLREILKDESTQEVDRLNAVIAEYDAEIGRLRDQVRQSGIPRELTAGKVSQCVSISLKIQALQQENDDLLKQKELQEARIAAEQELRQLIDQRDQCIGRLIAQINAKIHDLNQFVTNDTEIAPIFSISPDYEPSFATEGNFSEGTAFKGLILYDLAIAELFVIPALIHDSNILKRIEDTQLEHILQCYQRLGRQVFIAYDKAETATPVAQTILESSAVLHLSEGNVLFGKAWNRK